MSLLSCIQIQQCSRLRSVKRQPNFLQCLWSQLRSLKQIDLNIKRRKTLVRAISLSPIQYMQNMSEWKCWNWHVVSKHSSRFTLASVKDSQSWCQRWNMERLFWQSLFLFCGCSLSVKMHNAIFFEHSRCVFFPPLHVKYFTSDYIMHSTAVVSTVASARWVLVWTVLTEPLFLVETVCVGVSMWLLHTTAVCIALVRSLWFDQMQCKVIK